MVWGDKMPDQYTNEPLLDMFIFETSQLIEQLEQSILASEKGNGYAQESINEIFRIMHTIKGSSAMMMFSGISTLAHTIEDLFYYLRENDPQNVDCSVLSDLILEAVDFIKVELEKIKNGDNADSDTTEIISKLKEFLFALKRDNGPEEPEKEAIQANTGKQQHHICRDGESAKALAGSKAYKAIVRFEEGCEMENIRAFTIINNLKDITVDIFHIPEDIVDNDNSVEVIRRDGFIIYLRADRSYDDIYELLMKTLFLKELILVQLENDEFEKICNGIQAEAEEFISDHVCNDGKENAEAHISKRQDKDTKEKEQSDREIQSVSTQQSIINVSVTKLDKLMDLVGEMVIAEAMVVQNPDLQGLDLENFQKAAQQLHKITGDIQDMVMSIRMVPLSATFLKMHRIIRDMCKKLGKEVELKITGEETEVDKNVIEHISDPLMHLVRNALDHGIEAPEERLAKGKEETGTIALEAKNSGSDVLIIVKDDGRGMDKEKILKKAKENGLLFKPEAEMSDREIFNLIFLPGFSTKNSVTEFSGRGVGMDVVVKSIESINGSVLVDSTKDKGSSIILKIPLTLAIIDGMNIRVGSSCFTIPITSIRESFRPKENEVFTDPDGNEMIMVRGLCYRVLRLHEHFKIQDSVTCFTDGIIIMAEQDDKTVCIFADELLGQQQVVVKALPEYIRNFKKTRGLAGCTLLGDGSISLIIDISGLIGHQG